MIGTLTMTSISTTTGAAITCAIPGILGTGYQSASMRTSCSQMTCQVCGCSIALETGNPTIEPGDNVVATLAIKFPGTVTLHTLVPRTGFESLRYR